MASPVELRERIRMALRMPMTRNNMLAILGWVDQLVVAPFVGADQMTPFAFWVYVAAERRGELVHVLDDAIDDLTNCECDVTPLYALAETQRSSHANGSDAKEKP